MPTGRFKSVYAVSSEDPAHPASNLLKMQSGKKWKCKEVGEKSAYVILELDRSQKITGIDVGNEHSAFVMVSVGKRSYSRDEFKEILITSSLMTPIESKNSTTTHRVRCFSANALVESVAEEKWELVMALCTQPFNRNVQYGLSFLTVHVAEPERSPSPTPGPSSISNSSKPAESSFIGCLRMSQDSSDSDSDSGPSLFSRWKQARKDPLSAAAIRAASQPSSLQRNSDSLKPTKVDLNTSKSRKEKNEKGPDSIRDRNRDDLLFGEEDDVRNERLEKRISEDQERVRKEKELYQNKQKKKTDQPPNRVKELSNEVKKVKLNSTSDERKDEKVSSRNGNKASDASPAQPRLKRLSSPFNDTPSKPVKKLKQEEKPLEYRPFNQLLKGVVLVISGIQNPDRGTLRQKAIDLGARYKPDWDDTCTHLICAFKNTPKYNQVKGKGKIVTRHWIEKCHKIKKRLPWRRFALDETEGDQPESEDEIHDVSLKPQIIESDKEEATPSPQPVAIEEVPDKHESPARKDSTDDIMMHYDNDSQPNCMIPSGSDTDDEIEKVQAKQQKSAFEVSTDEDESIQIPGGSRKEPQLFDDLKFFLSETLPWSELSKIKQYIEQLRGEILDKPEGADYIISVDKKGLTEEFKGEIVKPRWILECQDMGVRLPTRRFLV